MFQIIMLGINAVFFTIVARWASQEENPDPVMVYGIGAYALCNLLAAILK
jgi:hypothetical protein